jgi:hypothetical protein
MSITKRLYLLIGFQALFTLLQTYLISKISTIGKIGIALFYKEYSLLRSGWKTFFLFFAIQMAVIAVLYITNLRSSKKAARLTAYVLIGMALLGLWFNLDDFLHTYSHRLLKERFHLAFYLFWAGWIASCVFFILNPIKRTEPVQGVVPEENPVT